MEKESWNCSITNWTDNVTFGAAAAQHDGHAVGLKCLTMLKCGCWCEVKTNILPKLPTELDVCKFVSCAVSPCPLVHICLPSLVTSIMATIELGSDGTGTIEFNGKSYSCCGKKDFKYTKDVTLHPSDCYKEKFSNEY